MRRIDLVVIHCAATPDDPEHLLYDVSAATIRKWHTDPKPRGRGWSDIGYHHVIRRDGRIEEGRSHEHPGAHVKGHNRNSIGVCLIGTRVFTPAQWHGLFDLTWNLATELYLGSRVAGHREFAAKECPGFNVTEWWVDVLQAKGMAA